MYVEIYIAEVAVDNVGKDVFRLLVELLMAVWRTTVCVIHDKLADGVLCGNLPSFAGRVPSAQRNRKCCFAWRHRSQ